MVIEPADPASHPTITQWTAVADGVTARLRTMKGDVKDAYCKVPLNELGQQAILFQDPKKLPESFAGAQGLAQLASIWAQNPASSSPPLVPTPSSDPSPAPRLVPMHKPRNSSANSPTHGTRPFAIRLRKSLSVMVSPISAQSTPQAPPISAITMSPTNSIARNIAFLSPFTPNEFSPTASPAFPKQSSPSAMPLAMQ